MNDIYRILQKLITVLFWVITQRIVVLSYWPFGPRIQTDSWPLKMGRIDRHKMLVRNYHNLLHNIPEQGSSHLISEGSLKSCLLQKLMLWENIQNTHTCLGYISFHELTGNKIHNWWIWQKSGKQIIYYPHFMFQPLTIIVLKCFDLTLQVKKCLPFCLCRCQTFMYASYKCNWVHCCVQKWSAEACQ